MKLSILPMDDSTPKRNTSHKLAELKSKLQLGGHAQEERQARPSKDTLFFLQMFARVYEPAMAVAV